MFNRGLSYFFVSLAVIFSISYSQDVVLSLDGNNLNYNSSSDIAGFQFNHNGV